MPYLSRFFSTIAVIALLSGMAAASQVILYNSVIHKIGVEAGHGGEILVQIAPAHPDCPAGFFISEAAHGSMDDKLYTFSLNAMNLQHRTVVYMASDVKAVSHGSFCKVKKLQTASDVFA